MFPGDRAIHQNSVCRFQIVFHTLFVIFRVPTEGTPFFFFVLTTTRGTGSWQELEELENFVFSLANWPQWPRNFFQTGIMILPGPNFSQGSEAKSFSEGVPNVQPCIIFLCKHAAHDIVIMGASYMGNQEILANTRNIRNKYGNIRFIFIFIIFFFLFLIIYTYLQ